MPKSAVHLEKRYLVTGGCGFIGSHLVDALIARGHKVTILDNLSTGKRENANKGARLIVGDTTDYATVEQAMRGIDGCFHLAAEASVEKSVMEWAHTHTVNVTSTVNIFDVASKASRKIPVVYTSSTAVYGDSREMLLSEESEPRPLTAYGVDKLACDMHGRVAWLVHSVPNIGLRPFNVYGPRQDPSSPYSGVVAIFADRVASGKPITIYGDGEQVRDFVYVADAVEAYATAMERLKEDHDVINICTGRGTSINMLADIISGVCGHKLPRNYAPPRRGDIRVSVGNPSKLSNTLGLSLETSLQEGLTRMLGRRKKAA